MNKKIDMLRGNVMGSLLRFAMPLVLTGWLQMLFSSADSLVVGRYAGSAALAAVGATFAFVMLIVCFFSGLSSGVTVCAANDVGAADAESYRETMHVSLLLAFLMGVAVLFLGEGLSGAVLRLMNAPADILDSAAAYLRLYFLCIPAQMVYNTGASLMRARGDSSHPLLFLASSGAANLALNILFVAFFHWDVVGVAAATVITQYLSACLVIRTLMREEEAWRLDPKKLCLRKKKIGDGLIFTTIESLTQACTVFTGQCVGAGLFSRTKTVFRDSLIITVIGGLLFGAAGFLLRRRIVALFLPDAPQAVAFGADRAVAVAAFAFIYSFMATLNASLRGYGVSVSPAVINIFAVFGFRLLWAHAYFPKHPTLFHLYISYPIGWSLAIVMLLIVFTPAVRKAIAQRESRGSA